MSKFVCPLGRRGSIVHAAIFGAAVSLMTLAWVGESYAEEKTIPELEKMGYTCITSGDTTTCTKTDKQGKPVEGIAHYDCKNKGGVGVCREK